MGVDETLRLYGRLCQSLHRRDWHGDGGSSGILFLQCKEVKYAEIHIHGRLIWQADLQAGSRDKGCGGASGHNPPRRIRRICVHNDALCREVSDGVYRRGCPGAFNPGRDCQRVRNWLHGNYRQNQSGAEPGIGYAWSLQGRNHFCLTN